MDGIGLALRHIEYGGSVGVRFQHGAGFVAAKLDGDAFDGTAVLVRYDHAVAAGWAFLAVQKRQDSRFIFLEMCL